MPSPALARLALAVPLALAGAALAGCGGSSDAGGSGSGTDVAITATDDGCKVADTSLDAGKVTFAVQNTGSKVTEVYVYGESGGGAFTKVVSEVENVGPGTGRDMTVRLAAGTYEVACKPGQTGDGIRRRITVAGEAGAGTSATPSTSDQGYDREIELTVDDSGVTGLDQATGSKGERLEVKLENETSTSRTLDVVSPSGKVSAEVEVPAGQHGEAIVLLSEAGDWTVKVEGGPKDVEQTLTVS